MRLKMLLGLRILPMLLVMGLIFVLSDQPGDALHLPQLPGIDKLAHIFIYGVLAASVIFAFTPPFRRKYPQYVVIAALLISSCYGISDELHQSYVPGRMVSGYDLLADICGALLVCLSWQKLNKIRAGVLRLGRISARRLVISIFPPYTETNGKNGEN
jgi:VanZ family protein